MKTLSKFIFTHMLCFTVASGFAQTSKPVIFAGFPTQVNCSPIEFSNAFSIKEGQHIVLYFSGGFSFSGTVTSNIATYYNLQSMTIQSDESSQTLFHLSRQLLSDNTISFVGRIMNTKAAEGYEISKDKEGNYRLRKFDAGRILPDCRM